MSQLNIFALFGILFLSSVLLGNGMYLNHVSVLAQENEAEVEADIEQENKCKKDTECENENEINNSLTITTITQAQEQPEIPTCETCFTDILSEEEISDFITAFNDQFKDPFELTSLAELCDYIEQIQGEQLNYFLLQSAQASISEPQYEALIECLQDSGLDVDFADT